MDSDAQSTSNATPGTKRRGFAAMSSEKRRLIASAGGKSAHSMGKAHVFNSEEAQAAGRKGGRTISKDIEHMARIGREGGTRRWARAASAPAPTENETEARPEEQ